MGRPPEVDQGPGRCCSHRVRARPFCWGSPTSRQASRASQSRQARQEVAIEPGQASRSRSCPNLCRRRRPRRRSGCRRARLLDGLPRGRWSRTWSRPAATFAGTSSDCVSSSASCASDGSDTAQIIGAIAGSVSAVGTLAAAYVALKTTRRADETSPSDQGSRTYRSSADPPSRPGPPGARACFRGGSHRSVPSAEHRRGVRRS
jgi:hypothetical protein